MRRSSRSGVRFNRSSRKVGATVLLALSMHGRRVVAVSPQDFGDPDGRRLGGDLALPPSSLPPRGGWFDAPEAEADEAPEVQTRDAAGARDPAARWLHAGRRERTAQVGQNLAAGDDGFRLGAGRNDRARRGRRTLAQRTIPSSHRRHAPRRAGDHGRGLEPANSASPRSMTTFRPSLKRSIACSIASRRFCWPTST